MKMTEGSLIPAFCVREVPVYGDLVLSPMDGFSDLPFRAMCRELGSAMSYSEFVNAQEVLQGSARVERKLAYLPEERPVVFQLFDSEPERIVEAALRLQERGPDIIDINMGCSAKCVSGRGAGAGLLRTPYKIAQIFDELSRQLEIPVTGKIRLGWDEEELNYLLIARIVEENGGALLAVHGRTKAQGYAGEADWEAIARVKQSVSIPVIGNGDVRTVADIEQMRLETGCDGVMIGRGTIGNPWIFSRLDRAQVPLEEVRTVMLRHLERMLAFYEGDYGLILFRKHASRYLSPIPLNPEQRTRLMTAEEPEEFLEVLDSMCINPDLVFPG
jgi:nifR3 family TIM-barrel protein